MEQQLFNLKIPKYNFSFKIRGLRKGRKIDDDIDFIFERTQSSAFQWPQYDEGESDESSGYHVESFSSDRSFRPIEDIFPDMGLAKVAVWFLLYGGYDKRRIWQECGIKPKVQVKWNTEVIAKLKSIGEAARELQGVKLLRLPNMFPGVPCNQVAVWFLVSGGASLRRIESNLGVPRVTVQRWFELVEGLR